MKWNYNPRQNIINEFNNISRIANCMCYFNCNPCITSEYPYFIHRLHTRQVAHGAAAVINRHFQNGETTCRHLSKRLSDNSTIFAAEATATSLALNYYQHMGPVHHDVVVYSDSMSCLQAIEGEDTENPFILFISWTCSGHWVTRAHVFVSAGYQATVTLTEMKEWTN